MSEEKKVPAVSAEILELSKQLQEKIKVGKDGADVQPEVYADYLLGNGITDEELNAAKRIDELTVPFIAGVAHAFGSQTPEVFKSNEDLVRITGTVPLLNKNVAKLTAKRQVTYPGGAAAEGEEAKPPLVIHNEIAVDISLRAARSGAGQLNAVKLSMRALGAEVLGDK